MRLARAALVAVLLAAACTRLLGGGQDRIRFSHDKHKDVGGCETCHAAIPESESLQKPPPTGTFLPKEATCLDCHEQKAEGKCDFCHARVDKAKAWRTDTRIVIPHKTHADAGLECSKCHAKLSEPGRPGEAPPMKLCFECHDDDNRQARCDKCHLELGRYPIKPVSSYSHEGRFLERHVASARAAPQSCALCHDQTFCADCHAAETRPVTAYTLHIERADREFIHRADYVSRHMTEAVTDPASCRRCHGNSFCQGCHTENQLTRSAANPRNPHPPGWTFRGGAQFHGTAARAEISSCAACHDQGANSNCVLCHSSGGIGGNPHPAGWNSRHDREDIDKNSMCRTCHR